MCDSPGEMTGAPPDGFTAETRVQSEAGHQRSVKTKSEVIEERRSSAFKCLDRKRKNKRESS